MRFIGESSVLLHSHFTVLSLKRLGLIGKKTGERAGKFSDWCWFFGTLIALVELSFERNVTKSKIKAGTHFHFLVYLI